MTLKSALCGSVATASAGVEQSTTAPHATPRRPYPGYAEPTSSSGPAIAPGGRSPTEAHPPTGPPGLLSNYLSRDDLAREFGIVPRTISRWTREPDGIPSITIGNRRLYRRESVLAWLEAREQRPSRTKRRRA
jgi:hypothetical protein